MAQQIELGRHVTVAGIVAGGLAVSVGLVAGLLDFAASGRVAVSGMALVHGALALVAGAVLASLFGRAGLVGWVTAVLVGALITVAVSLVAPILGPAPDLGAVQASAIAPSLAPTSSARPFALPMALLASPFLGLLWLSLISAVHAAAGGARQA